MNTQLTEKQQLWSDRLQQAEAAGQSLAEYGRIHNIPAQKLYQWRSTLKEYEETSEISTERHFTRVITTGSTTCLSLQFPEAHLRFTTLPDPAWLAELLHKHAVCS